jgi:hypothetical protein
MIICSKNNINAKFGNDQRTPDRFYKNSVIKYSSAAITAVIIAAAEIIAPI